MSNKVKQSPTAKAENFKSLQLAAAIQSITKPTSPHFTKGTS